MNSTMDGGTSRSLERAAHFPVLSANTADGAGRLLTGRGCVIENVAGARIAVIGVIMGDVVGNLGSGSF
jgi:hypothetical protein